MFRVVLLVYLSWYESTLVLLLTLNVLPYDGFGGILSLQLGPGPSYYGIFGF